MFSIISPVTLNMPELGQAGSLNRLPWPDGSVVSARLLPSEVPGNALLILGSYRLLAQVPPNTPMGEVWLLLVNRQMPARFSVMNDAQVVQMLAGMLESERSQQAKGAGHKPPATQLPGAISGAMEDGSDWPDLRTPQRHDGRQALPWSGEATGDGNTMLWYDRQDEQPRGMLNRRIEQQHFSLSGRVDLDRLGIISFSLKGRVAEPSGDDDATGSASAVGGGDAWQLSLQAQPGGQLNILRQSFDEWIGEQRPAFPEIRAEIVAGMPESASGGLTERTA